MKNVPSIGNVCPALWWETWTLLAVDLKTLEALHVRCQRQILDIRWWGSYVSNAEVLQRSGLSTIGDILLHRRLSLFGHVARLDSGVPAHYGLRLMAESQWPAGEDHRAALSTLCGQFLRQTENTVTVCTRVQWPSDLDTDSSYKGLNLVTCFGHVRLTTWSKKSVYQYQYIESLNTICEYCEVETM